MIKSEEDGQEPIVTKFVETFLFFRALTENLWTADSNYVPNLAAAMIFFYNIDLWS